MFSKVTLFVGALLFFQSAIYSQTCTNLFQGDRVEDTYAKPVDEIDLKESVLDQIESYARSIEIADYKSVSDLIGRISMDVQLRFGKLHVISQSAQFAEMVKPILDIAEQPIENIWKTYGATSGTRQNRIDGIKQKIEQDYSEQTEQFRKQKYAEVTYELSSAEQSLYRLKYLTAKEIAHIEKFRVDQYQEIKDPNSLPLINSNYVVVSLPEFPQFAMALAIGQSPPKNYGTGGVVSFSNYRDFVSNNLWLFTLAEHDLKHIHFAQAHPLATGSLFRLTRSQNHLRYGLTAAMFEGVDTVQYGFESQLARLFNSKGYTLEHAMLHLASATQAELYRLGLDFGVVGRGVENTNPTLTSHLAGLIGWQPKRVAEELRRPEMPKDLELDIEDFVDQALAQLSDPEKLPYLRPELNDNIQTKPAGSRMKPGDHIHHR